MNALLTEALNTLQPHIVAHLYRGADLDRTKDNVWKGPEDYDYFHGNNHHRVDNAIARIRVDYELMDSSKPETNEEIVNLLFRELHYDLNDLIENGDREQGADPLIRAFDGSKKRNKSAVAVDIFGCALVWEYSEARRSTDYTIYILMYVEWQ